MGYPETTVTVNGTSNPTPNTKVDKSATVPVTLTARLFPASTTAAMEKNKRGESKALVNLPLIFGKVIGGKFEPFKDVIRKAPTLTPFDAGRLENGLFVRQTAADKTTIAAAKAKANDTKLDKTERDKAQAEYKALDAQWVRKLNDNDPPLGYHDMPLNAAIAPGTTVGICINVDTKKKFRQFPLWQITAGNNDIVIDVFETYGKHYGLDDSAQLVETRNEGTKEKPHLVDYYTARLTGDIWKRSTHPFTAADVDAMPKDRATDAMRTALKKIYAADFTMVGQNFAIDVPLGQDEKDTASVRLQWIAGENQNCIDNIQSLDLKKDVPSRIHPEAYAAAANAAIEANVTEIRFSSSWRPMLGSIAHRSGLGLDVVWLKSNDGATHLNRHTLGKSEGENVSKDEETAFNDWQNAKDKAARAQKAKEAAEANEATAAQAYAKLAKNGKASSEMIAEAKKKADEATAAREAATQASQDAKTAVTKKHEDWGERMKKEQPKSVDNFRSNIMRKPIVKQVLDPWYIDKNTHDSSAPTVNDQSDGLEKQHNNHMHITIDDPELGIGQ